MEKHALHKRMRETGDLNISEKSLQFTRDSRDLIISKNSILGEIVPGAKNGKSTAFPVEMKSSFNRERESPQLSNNTHQCSNTQGYSRFSSISNTLHWKKASKQRMTILLKEKGEDTAFLIIQMIHN